MTPRIDIVVDENEVHMFVTRQISEEEALQKLGVSTPEEALEHSIIFQQLLENY